MIATTSRARPHERRLHRRVAIAALVLASPLAACGDGCPVTREVPVTELSSVAEALDLAEDVEAIRFVGEVRREYVGLHRWTVGGTRGATPTHAVAALVPVVPPGWTEKDPVPLWVRVDARSGSPEVPIDVEIEAFASAVAAGPVSVRVSQRLEASVDMDGTNAFQIATRSALDTHGLQSPVGTPIGSWPLEPGPLRLAE
jgi:hypothetical protein